MRTSKRNTWISTPSRLVTLSVALVAGMCPCQQLPSQPTSETQGLMTRVGSPSHLALDEFRKAGMEDIKPHVLTAAERSKVESALSSLPALHQKVLFRRLHSLAFVDGVPGEGTGLTSPDATKGLYDITLRASLLDESLSTFLTTKEQREFTADGSGVTVTVEGTGADALTYVLLHESTHIVDKSCGITTATENPFTADIWTGYLNLAPPLAASVAATTYFRGGRRLGSSKAASVYDALSLTPFVSLYSTASKEEDFAELVAWHEMLIQHHGGLIVAMEDSNGKPLRQWRPLDFAGVRKRFLDVDSLLTSVNACDGVL
jgi:hypothetical protein